jgi:hypothetical protein
MSKSTMIKDLDNGKNDDNHSHGEDDLTIQEVLTEIENDKKPDQNNHEEINLKDFSNQLLQQQLLQQQLLQQQLLQQNKTDINNIPVINNSIENKQNESIIMKSTLGLLNQLILKKKDFLGILILHLIFNKVDITALLKIDKISIFTSYPYLESLFRSILFSLIAVTLSYII